jgi:predicted  nucleic acid-binding Zn-ribbon protein
MSQEEKDLETHVALCAERYAGIQEKMDALQRRITKVEDSLLSLKTEIQSGFNSIALKLEKENNKRTIQLITSAGAIVVAVIGAIGVWLAHR